MLVNLKEILNAAKQGGYAVPAFNVYNMETIMGVIYAAERLHAPVIIQSYSRLFKEDTSSLYCAHGACGSKPRQGSGLLSSGSRRV